ncbi:MAG: hypothetical protein MZV70_05950 [Desulfobacterales bacterium]|nr:hypothetical protein [Desulfobacterales bacterium]
MNGLFQVPVLGVVLGGVLAVAGRTGTAGQGSDGPQHRRAYSWPPGAAGLVSLVLPGLRAFLFGAGGLALVGFGALQSLQVPAGTEIPGLTILSASGRRMALHP